MDMSGVAVRVGRIFSRRFAIQKLVFILIVLLALPGVALSSVPSTAYGDQPEKGKSDIVKIHVLPLNVDAIIIECNGRFGMVDSGEDSDYPDGSDARYPLRNGITIGQGNENEVLPYLRSIGVSADNFDFYIGTHPHSDHIALADEVIYEFRPHAICIPYYEDAFVTSPSYLWDNLYVYDRMIEAAEWARESYGARLIQFFEPGTDMSDGASAEVSSADGAPQFGSAEWVSERTGFDSFQLGSAKIEILNYDNPKPGDAFRVPDANFYCLGVKVTGANGRSAFLAGDINDYAADWSRGGDETKLAGDARLRNIDFLKMGHHGLRGSSTPGFLRAILRPASGAYHPLAVQTGQYSSMPMETVNALHSAGVRHYLATYASGQGKSALVVTLASAGLATNIDGDGYVLHRRNTKPWAFVYSDGLPVLQWHGWVNHDRIWRYFEADGSLAMGWKRLGGTWYYLDGSTGAMLTGWQRIDGTWYYFNVLGAMLTGWQIIDGKWYYLNSSGAMVEGWAKVGGAWYYLKPGNGDMATGWVKDGGAWYYCGPSGAMKVGWQKIGGKWYYLKGSGAMAEGWYKVGRDWYWANSSGVMQSNRWIGGYYYVTGSGAMATNAWIGRYHVNASGLWDKTR